MSDEKINMSRAALMAALAGLDPKIGTSAADLINVLNDAGVPPKRVEELLQNFAGPIIEGAQMAERARILQEMQAEKGQDAKKE